MSAKRSPAASRIQSMRSAATDFGGVGGQADGDDVRLARGEPQHLRGRLPATRMGGCGC